MKIAQTTFQLFSIFALSFSIVRADLEPLPDFTISDKDRDLLAQVHNNFRAEMASAQTENARKLAIINLWETNTLTPPAEPQTDADRKVAIEMTVKMLLGKRRPIFYAVRDGGAAEFGDIQERKAVFAKSVAYMALISDQNKLGPQIPALLESRRTRSSFSRDDHFASLVIYDLASQCHPVDSFNAEELENWKKLANATNAACRLTAVTVVGRVTNSVTDKVAVFSETVDETELHILSVIIEESAILSDDDRVKILKNLRENNSNLSKEQVLKINSILE